MASGADARAPTGGEPMTVSTYIAQFLRAQQIDTVFEMAGGMITHLLDALAASQGIRIVSMHHEQAAAFAADAFGRMTGRPGVAFATSGPGATNLLTGIASCYFDSTPAVFITGQVNTHEQKKTRSIRQLGFQETNIVSMAAPVTKAAIALERPGQIRSALTYAFETAASGRPGPVLIDIPMDLQRAEIHEDQPHLIACTRPLMSQEFSFARLESDLRTAARPLLLAGAGVRLSGAREDLLRFVERTHIPVVTSLLGLDLLSFDHPLRMGFIGSYGNRWANQALALSDLLIVIGSRLDIRQTGADTKSFQSGKKIYHIDCDKSEINNRISGCEAVASDAGKFLRAVDRAFASTAFEPRTSWINEISRLRAHQPDTNEVDTREFVNPNRFLHELSRVSPYARAFVADVGNHQMWCAQSLELAAHQRFLTSGGMGSMGFALPAAIGASISARNAPIVVIAGDGGFQLNLQELQTIVHHKLPVKIVVLNNHCLGMIRQFQDSYFESRYQSTLNGYSAPDFAAVASAYGIESRSILHEGESADACRWLWSNGSQPSLLQVHIGTHVNAYPKIAFGKPISEMEPLASPDGMEGT
ncbi:MAG TPA: thiamine pyrophosphate-binding protein [Bacteroidota bacterium]|nr:thiamine pyrophosphate-binding protein [Bacteroidota bacterium]